MRTLEELMKDPKAIAIVQSVIDKFSAHEKKANDYFLTDDFKEKFAKCKKYLKRSKYSLNDCSYFKFPVKGVSNDDFTLIVDTIIRNNENMSDKVCNFPNNMAIYEGVCARMMFGQGTAFNMWIEK